MTLGSDPCEKIECCKEREEMSETLKAKIRHQRLARTAKIDEIKKIEQLLEIRKQEKRKFDEGPCGFCTERAPKRQKIEAPA